MSDGQYPGELEAHFAQGSPALAAVDWVNGSCPGPRRGVGTDRARIVRADRSDGWLGSVLDHLDEEFRKGMPAWSLGRSCGDPVATRAGDARL
jgi:hypothetical protein